MFWALPQGWHLSFQTFLLRRKGEIKKDEFILSGVEGLQSLTHVELRKSTSVTLAPADT